MAIATIAPIAPIATIITNLIAATRKAGQIEEAAREAGVHCTPEEANRLAGVGPARQWVRQALLVAWATTQADVLTPSELDGDAYECTRAVIARGILVAYATGSGGGWQDPGAGTARHIVPDALGFCVEGGGAGYAPAMLAPLAGSGVNLDQGGRTRLHARSGPAWTAAAVQAMEELAPSIDDDVSLSCALAHATDRIEKCSCEHSDEEGRISAHQALDPEWVRGENTWQKDLAGAQSALQVLEGASEIRRRQKLLAIASSF